LEKIQEIKINRVANSRIGEIDFNKIPFGRVFSDHMVICDYKDGKWSIPEIVPFEAMEFLPGLISLHYGQSIFEGIKAFRNKADQVVVFRADQNARRFNISAGRMCMPSLPEDVFLKSIHSLIAIDQAWVPSADLGSLYIRPFMFGTDQFIGVHASKEYRFCIFTCPSGPYFSRPVSTKIETLYSRASLGGIGYAKAAANYAAALYPTQMALDEGFDQVIWTDAKEHRFIEEAGTMNIFFRLGDTLVTPPLGETILDGVTRKSAIQIARDCGIPVEERKVSIEELETAYNQGHLIEAFGVGTAAVVSPIAEIGLGDKRWTLNQNDKAQEYSNRISNTLKDLRFGTIPDTHGWLSRITEPAWVV
jgi:branched-chain amino acid aminotransferase